MSPYITRRAALAALATSAVFSAVTARAEAPEKFRAIEVDVSPLRSTGDAISAGWIAAALPELLKTAFADHLAPGDRNAPVLVARVDSISYGSPGSAMDSFNSTNDFIEGAAIVKSAGGKTATFPLTTFAGVDAALTDAPNGGELRALALAGVFARWLPGQMGL